MGLGQRSREAARGSNPRPGVTARRLRANAAAGRLAALTIPAMLAAGCAPPRHAAVHLAAQFDLSALPIFWEVHDRLRRGEEPTDSLWNALWGTPGYALLEAKERRRATLSRALRVAYAPWQRAAADSVLSRNGDWLSRVVRHLREVSAARGTLATYERDLSSNDLMERGQRLAQAYLPEGTVRSHPAPAVSFLYFLDARGYPERILLDPLYFMRLRNQVEVIAHEYHHYYRSRVARPQRPYGDDLLAWTLSTVESEGLAGMLDKRDVPSMNRAELEARYVDPSRRAYFAAYQVEYRRSNERLRQVEDVLERIGQHADSAGPLGAWLHRELPDNGRIMGAFMSEVIEQQLGRERLVAVVGDPFAFWRLYNEAARRTNGAARVLSERAMAVVAAVGERYRAGSP
jgi:hypothetical protein